MPRVELKSGNVTEAARLIINKDDNTHKAQAGHRSANPPSFASLPPALRALASACEVKDTGPGGHVAPVCIKGQGDGRIYIEREVASLTKRVPS